MSELPPHRILEPDSIIEFGDVAELTSFEDDIAKNMFPNMTSIQLNAWQGRVALKGLVRPPNFNGRVGDIQLHVMTDPYPLLMSARERGLKFGGERGKPTPRVNEFVSEAESLSEGFVFTANAYSSGAGIIGQIETELWYVPVPRSPIYKTYTRESGRLTLQSRGAEQLAGQNGGAIVQRYVAAPTVSKNDIENKTTISQGSNYRDPNPYRYSTGNGPKSKNFFE
jgi:hypothetical protein